MWAGSASSGTTVRLAEAAETLTIQLVWLEASPAERGIIYGGLECGMQKSACDSDPIRVKHVPDGNRARAR